MFVLELHKEDAIILYDPQNMPQPARPGQPRTGYLLQCIGRYDEATNTIWIPYYKGQKPLMMPLGFVPEVRDFR